MLSPLDPNQFLHEVLQFQGLERSFLFRRRDEHSHDLQLAVYFLVTGQFLLRQFYDRVVQLPSRRVQVVHVHRALSLHLGRHHLLRVPVRQDRRVAQLLERVLAHHDVALLARRAVPAGRVHHVADQAELRLVVPDDSHDGLAHVDADLQLEALVVLDLVHEGLGQAEHAQRRVDGAQLLRDRLLDLDDAARRHVSLADGLDFLDAVDVAEVVEALEDLVQELDDLVLAVLDDVVEVGDVAEEDGDVADVFIDDGFAVGLEDVVDAVEHELGQEERKEVFRCDEVVIERGLVDELVLD